MLTINKNLVYKTFMVFGMATFFFTLWVPAYAGSLTLVMIVGFILFSYYASVLWFARFLVDTSVPKQVA